MPYDRKESARLPDLDFATFHNVRVGAKVSTYLLNSSFLSGGDTALTNLIYGEISVYDSSDGATSLGGDGGKDDKAQFLFFDTNGPANGTTPDHSEDHITIVNAGVYLILVSSTFTGANNNEYGLSVYLNNGTTELENLHWHRSTGAAGAAIGSTSASGLTTLSVGDTVEVWVWNEDSANDIEISDITLTIIRVGS